MLFNSPVFLLGFLPVTLLLYVVLRRTRVSWAIAWLVVASLAFYGWWNPAYLGLLLASIAFNFLVGRQLQPSGRHRKAWVVLGLAVNLFALGYYKYAGFFLETVTDVTGWAMHMAPVVLPLGISFFTFTQIAYLIDAYRGQAGEYSPLRYLLFVTFFPHLIAGPILHHRDMMPQFLAGAQGMTPPGVALGLILFVIGLLKKVLLADPIGAYANSAFALAHSGGHPSVVTAWTGAVAYALQLYFDFSAYSDMALGLAAMFGIRFPINFNSPYQARSIIDFWRRWHMSLSAFLRDYVYIPLGGSRCGPVRRQLNLFATVMLGAVWHGSGWTYIVWGALHCAYLLVNHSWRHLTAHRLPTGGWALTSYRTAAMALTFGCVVVSVPFFRAEGLDAAWRMSAGMFGLNRAIVAASPAEFAASTQVLASLNPALLLGLLAIAFWAPNSTRIVAWLAPRFEAERVQGGWAPAAVAVLAGFSLFCVAKSFAVFASSPFLYFNF